MFEFIVTVFESLVIISLAVVVYTSRRHDFLNRSFSLYLILFAAWVLTGFPHLLTPEPSASLVTTQFRIAHLTATLATGVFFLFGLGFLRGRRPGRVALGIVSVVTLLMSLGSISDYVLRSVSYSDGIFYLDAGLGFYLFGVFMIVFGGGGLLCIAIRCVKSKDTNRTRGAYILIGFGTFLVMAITLVIIVPTIMGVDKTSSYIFLLAFIPTGFTAYAILKHNLLDVRIAIRRSFAFMLTLSIFGTLLVLSYIAFRFTLKDKVDLEMVVSIAILALTIALVPQVLRWSNRIADKILFPGLFDEVDLLHETTTLVAGSTDIWSGLSDATSIICNRLELEKLIISICGEFSGEQVHRVLGTCRVDGKLAEFQAVDCGSSEDKSGIAACLPIQGPTMKVGLLKIGDKTGHGALSPYDMGFLSSFTSRVALFLEHHFLTLQVLSQFQELTEARSMLEESNRFRNEIIDVASHELKTPLTILNSFVEILLNRHESSSVEERMEYLGYVKESCRRLTSILDQFLTSSDLQRGAVGVGTERVPVEVIFEHVRSELKPGDSGRLRIELQPTGLMVNTDPHFLQIMIRNVVENALRFSPDGEMVTLRATSRDDGVEISVKDRGTGINSKELSRVFQPFARIEDVDKHQRGMGLGLYIVQHIARLLGIDIRVDSQSGEGTVLSFKLPSDLGSARA